MRNIVQVEPVLRLRAGPNDANKSGDIFGGWLMVQIDIAGAIVAVKTTQGPVATVSVQALNFLKPLYINDLVSLYVHTTKIGHTSITVEVNVFAERLLTNEADQAKFQAAEATLVYVAVKKPGEKRIITK